MKRLSNFLLLMLTAVLLATFITSCSSDDGDPELPYNDKEEEEFSETVDEKPNVKMELANPEEFIVNEDNYIVEAAGCTIEVSPTIMDGDTKLSVSKATQAPWMISTDDHVTAVKVQVGNLSEYSGVVKIRIPVNFGKGQTMVAGQWSESDLDWEPALCEYDKVKGEAVIWTDTPGTFGVTVKSGISALTRADNKKSTFGPFIVSRANTRDAGIYEKTYQYIDWEDPPYLVFDALLGKLFGGNLDGIDEADVITQNIIDTKAIFGDITYPLLQEMGLSKTILDKTAGLMGKVAVAATFYQKMRAVYTGDVDKEKGMKLKEIYDLFVSKAASLCKSSAMNLCMISVAIIDYSLNKFAEEAWAGRKELYRAAYQLYYSEGQEGYRSRYDWYDLFWPGFIKDGMTESRISYLIDGYVTKYCDEFWENTDRIATYLALAKDIGFTSGGGLNEKIKKEISDEYRQYLYNNKDRLPEVFERIGEKLKKRQYDIMKDQMISYAYHMDKYVTLHLKDVNASGGSSDYAGYKVKFKRLPISIIDPEYWECKLNDKGEGDIKFRLFGYVAANVSPQLVVVSPSGKEEISIPLKNIQPGTNIVEFGKKKEEEKSASVSPTELTFVAEGGTKSVKVTAEGYSKFGYGISEKYKSWLSAKTVKGGTIEITAQPNTTGKERIGYVRAYVCNEEKPTEAQKVYLKDSIKVTQAANKEEEQQQEFEFELVSGSVNMYYAVLWRWTKDFKAGDDGVTITPNGKGAKVVINQEGTDVTFTWHSTISFEIDDLSLNESNQARISHFRFELEKDIIPYQYYNLHIDSGHELTRMVSPAPKPSYIGGLWTYSKDDLSYYSKSTIHYDRWTKDGYTFTEHTDESETSEVTDGSSISISLVIKKK
ncbi:MAG: hypothetical protein IJ665_05890 [Phocaeicola sp.]|nr:hypothetical protein [Phocaeicola sp.]